MRNIGMYKIAMLIVIALVFSFQTKAYYQPQEGRFMQRDPLGVNPAGGVHNSFTIRKQYSDGMNLYEYLLSNPLSSLDPFGLCVALQFQAGIHGGLVVNGSIFDYGPAIGDKSKTIPIGAGKCPYSSSEPTNGVYTNLSKSSAGYLGNDVTRNGKPVPCQCATCGEVVQCLAEECRKWNKVPYFLPYPNCWTFVSTAKSKCCLQ
jgi:RHS repeat-associated protein